MGKALSEELIKMKTRQDSLGLIRNLNLWGQDIDDLKVLKIMPNLEVLSLSVNKIATLKEIGNCPKLKELYLRKNSISNLSEIRHLVPLNNLKVLWLSDNPCASIPNYRQIVINALPGLDKLDNLNITEEDRTSAQFVQDNNSWNYNNEVAMQNQESISHNTPKEAQSPMNNNSYNKGTSPINNNNNNSNNEKQYKSSASLINNGSSSSQLLNQQGSKSPISSGSTAAQVTQQQAYSQRNVNSNSSQHPCQQSGFDENTQDDCDNQQSFNRNQNIVCAIMSLMKDLDYNSLEVLRRDIERKLSQAGSR